MAKFSRPFLVFYHVTKLRRIVKIDTQKLRSKALTKLERLFDMALV